MTSIPKKAAIKLSMKLSLLSKVSWARFFFFFFKQGLHKLVIVYVSSMDFQQFEYQTVLLIGKPLAAPLHVMVFTV